MVGAVALKEAVSLKTLPRPRVSARADEAKKPKRKPLNQNKMKKHNKWQWRGLDDEDTTMMRVFDSVRMTEKRLKIVSNFVNRHNEEWSAPYGVSPNGYAYRCGCVHDCCGCLSSNQMRIEKTPKAIIIFHTISYNY